ncbi:MAG TPA: hypothetical protein VLK59_13880 [Solirubrobacteraceae bacterium]|nr:hypothetical protein [Solirubrobacteraceae bacterium]
MAVGVDLQGTTATIDADAWPKGLNRELRRLAEEEGVTEFVIENPRSRHNLGVGQTADVTMRFRGSVGNYCGGLNWERPSTSSATPAGPPARRWRAARS